MRQKRFHLFGFLLGVFFALAMPALAQTGTFEPPKLIVPIPSLKFSQIVVSTGDGTKNIDVPWLAQYINAAYRYGILLATTIATVMFMVGAFQVLSGGDSGRVATGKERIKKSLIGLLLAMGAYTLLYVVNPDLTNLDALRVTVIDRVDFKTEAGLLRTMGTTADNYSNGSVDGSDSAHVPGGDAAGAPVTSGKFRETMLAACAGKNGMTLSPDQRKERLKQILQVWKSVGADQGGAIYLRGGSTNCKVGAGAQTSFMLGSMVTYTKNGVPPQLSAACQAAVDQVLKDPTKTGEVARANEGCHDEFLKVYDQLSAAPPRNAGMFCGDCYTTQMALYNCFDSSFNYSYFSTMRISQVCPKSDDPRYVYVLNGTEQSVTNDMIDQAVKKLQFGDVMAWQQLTGGKAGHVYLYTGGAGLDYEIMEMGGGGSNDQTSAGGAKASKNAGFKWLGAGMQTQRSAVRYLQAARHNAMGKGNGCLYAFRPFNK